MASLTPSNSFLGEMQASIRVPELESTSIDFKVVEVVLEKSSVQSLAQRPEVLDVVKQAWISSLQRISKEKSVTVKVLSTSESCTVVQTSFNSGGVATPPATPTSAFDSSLLQETTITFSHSREEKSKIGSQVDKALVHLDVCCDQQWRIDLRYKPDISADQVKELVESLQHDLTETLKGASTLPPSPAKTSFSDSDYEECPTIEQTIHGLIEEQATARPEHEAVCAHDGSLSYSDLVEMAYNLAQELTRLGAGPEQRVAILMPKCLWYTVSVLSVLKSGAAFVPLDPGHPENRLKQLVGEIEPCALITLSSLVGQAQGLCSAVVPIDTFDFNTAEKTVVVAAKPHNAAYMIFTSGSTGKPKGVVIEHSALCTSAVSRGTVLGIGPDSRVLQYAPHTFDVSVDEILTTLIHGGCVCVPSDADRFGIAEFMEKTRVTAALLTPTSARTLSPDDVPTLRTLQTGGEVLTEDVNDKWSSRVTLFNVYGPTEASVACVISNRTGMQGTGHVLGQAVGGKLWIVDPDDVTKRLPDNDTGELVISGPILARGYFRDPVRTESSFVKLPTTGERVYRTGDLASMDADGTISYHGRKDLEIKIRGQRINIAEIEHAILQCEVVHSVVVEFPKKGLSDRRLTAVICLEDDRSKAVFEGTEALTEDVQNELLAHVSGVLTPAMIPAQWLSIPWIPQTTSGKADRKQVRGWLEEMDQETHAHIFNITAPSTESSSNPLLPIWQKVLKTDACNIHLSQSFIRNGGDSIMAMEARKLFHEAGLSIKIPELLGGQSLEEIGRLASVSSSPATTIDDDKDEPFELSPVQQMYFDTVKDSALGIQQRVSVEIMQHVQPYMLRTALNHIVCKHRMLAARFFTRNGKWLQEVPFGEFNPESLYKFYIEGCPCSASHLYDFCTRPMNIEEGPLLHAHLHGNDGSQTLVLCAHHLVADFVSWRIILQDLYDALVSVMKGATIDAGQPMLGFQQWIREQKAFAEGLVPSAVLPYTPGPVDLEFWQSPPSDNTFGTTTTSTFRLSSSQTAQFLEKFTGSNIHPTDALLGTFASAFQSVFPERPVPNVFVEGHGRESWTPALDVTKTVGWFTAAYPIHLPSSTLQSIGTAISAATARRTSVPGNGFNYWACRYLSESGKETFGNDPRYTEMEVVLNYAGTVVQKAPGSGLFGENLSIAEMGHPDAPRFSVFDVGASIEPAQDGEGQELVVVYGYPAAIAHGDRVEQLVQSHQDLLVEAVGTDLTMSSLSCPDEIATLLSSNGLVLKDVENIYTASPIQQSMLRRQAQEPWFYRVKGNWVIEPTGSSKVDIDRIVSAWKDVVAKHSTLRTVFGHSEGTGKFTGVVLKNIEPKITLTYEDQMNTSLCKDEDEMTPPHAMTLKKLSNGSIECQLEFSHTIIDAASRQIVLQDLADAYEGNLSTMVSLPFWEYANLTNAQIDSSDLSTMAGSLPRVGRVSTLNFKPTMSTSSAMILTACKNAEITVSSFFMGAWTFGLSKHLSTANVSFDYVLSDRSAAISGIEGAVGPYIRLPSCETAVDGELGVLELAKKIHVNRSAQSSDGLSLPSTATSKQGLSSLVNIRNSGSSMTTLSSSGDGTVKWTLESFEDPWDYDLVFAVNMAGSEICGWSVEFCDQKVSKDTVLEIAKEIGAVVENMVN